MHSLSCSSAAGQTFEYIDQENDQNNEAEDWSREEPGPVLTYPGRQGTISLFISKTELCFPSNVRLFVITLETN